MKKTVTALALAAAMTALCACQSTPEKGVVTSKNDGAFQAALESTPAPAAETAPGEAAVYTDSFTNSDGSVRFDLSLTEPEHPEALPVYLAKPMDITAEKAEQMAYSLLGEDTEFYEYSTMKTREELEEAILETRQIIGDRDALLEELGGDEELLQQTVDYYENRLETLEQMYSESSDGLAAVPCQWTFRSYDEYADPLWNLDIDESDMAIMATATVDGMDYLYEVENLESEERREHSVSLMNTGRLQAEEPDVDAVLAKPQTLADALDVGPFAVSSCYRLSTTGTPDDEGPIVNVIMSRVVDGLLLTGSGENMPDGTGETYAPRYTYESIFMQFWGDQLGQFVYSGALEIVETVNESVPGLAFDQIVDAAKTQMKLKLPMYSALAKSGGYERYDVNEARLELRRSLIQNDFSQYYLIPVYAFAGAYHAYAEDGSPGTVTYGTETVPISPDDHMTVTVINAVDGSVYDSELGY